MVESVRRSQVMILPFQWEICRIGWNTTNLCTHQTEPVLARHFFGGPQTSYARFFSAKSGTPSKRTNNKQHYTYINMFHPSPKKWFPSTVTDAYKKQHFRHPKKRKKTTKRLDLHLPKKQVPAPRPISSLHPPAWNKRWWTPRGFWLRPGPGQTADSMILGSGEVEAFRKIITTSKWSEVILTLVTCDISVVLLMTQ